jgi:hypothetical protein
MRILIVATIAALFSSTASAQEPSQGRASIPDFSGTWGYPFCCTFEPPLSGPGPVLNKSRVKQTLVRWPAPAGYGGSSRKQSEPVSR